LFAPEKAILAGMQEGCPCADVQVYGHIKDVYEPFWGVPISGCLGDQMAALLGVNY